LKQNRISFDKKGVHASGVASKPTMRKIKEVLRLRYGLGLSQDQIAGKLLDQSNNHRYLERAAAALLAYVT
jgi:hypothetical protein